MLILFLDVKESTYRGTENYCRRRKLHYVDQQVSVFPLSRTGDPS